MQGHTTKLFELNEEIHSELLAMQDTLSWLPEGELDNGQYLNFSNRIGYIQSLFDKAAIVMRDMSFDQSQPDLISLLEAKDNIQLNHDRFHRLSRDFHRRYDKEDELSQEEERARVMERSDAPLEDESEPVEDEPIQTDDSAEQEAMLEEMLAAEEEEEEKEAKAKKKKAEENKAEDRRARERRQMEEQNRADTAAAESARHERERWDEQRRWEEERRWEEDRRLIQSSPLFTPLSDPQPFQQPFTPGTSQSFEQPAPLQQGNTSPIQPIPQTPTAPTPAPQPAPTWKDVEDLRQIQFRDAERRSHEERIRQEQRLLREEQSRRYYESGTQSRYNYDATAKRHFDFSTIEGEYGRRQDGRTDFKAYSYTPGGTVELSYNRDISSANSNPVIAAGIGSQISRTASSAYENTMRHNMQAARLEYESKRGTPEAKDALRNYINQRDTLVSYRDNLRTGRTETVAPTVTPHTMNYSSKNKYYAGVRPIQFQYTPYGIVGNSVQSGHLSGSQTAYRVPYPHTHQGHASVLFPRPQTGPQKTVPDHAPIHSSSANRTGTAASSPRVPYSVLRKLPDAPIPVVIPRPSPSGPTHYRVTGANISSADIRTGPNGMSGSDWLKAVKIDAKQRSHNTSSGTSGFNASSGKKAETKETSSNVFTKKSKLNSDSVALNYGKKLGNITASSLQRALSSSGWKMYQMVQSSDETGTLRGIENARYYTVTTVGVAHALTHAKVVSSSRTEKRGLLRERGYGRVGALNSEELSKAIQRNKDRGTALKEEIKALKKKGIDLTGDELSTLSNKIKEKRSIDRESRKLNSLFKVRDNAAATVAFERAVEKEAKGRPIRTKHADAVLQNLQNEAKNLKKQIEALKKKGPLNAADTKKLSALLKRKADVDAQIKAGTKSRAIIAKNRGGLTRGLSALQNIFLKPLNQGDEIGAAGIAKVAQASTNHYVHAFVKRSVHYSVVTGKYVYIAGRWTVVTVGRIPIVRKTGAAIAKPVKAAGTALSKTRPVKAGKRAIYTGREAVFQTKVTLKTGAAYTKEAIERLTPKPVKTAIRTIRGIPGKIRGAREAVKKWFLDTRLGRAYTWVNRITHGFLDAIKVGLAFLKGLAIKALLAVAAFILIVLLIVTVVTALGGAATSVILAPGATADGKFDLSPYNNILVREWEAYEEELLEMGETEGYYRTTVEIEPNVPNTREILSMMSVRMSQELDMRTNPDIEPYLCQLLRDLNPYNREEGTCFCDTRDCKTHYWETQEQIGTDDGGNPIYETVPHSIDYCPGDHPTLTIKLESLHFDDAFSADSMGAADAGISGAAGEVIGRFTITYYCTEERPHPCNAGPPYQTATGTKPTPGRTIAVDPSVIPLNTRVIIDGHEYVAEDTGGAIDGNRIDIVVRTHAEALRKGIRNNVPVYSVSYNGSDIIDSGLWNGWTDGNIEWAKNIYSQDWTELYSGIPNVTDLIGNSTDLSGVDFINGDRPGNNAISNVGRAQLGNAGGQKFWSWYGFDYRVEWCAIFVSWCADQTWNLGTAVPKFALVEDGIRWYQSRGQWASSGATTPVAGDIIFFDWGADGNPDHVGIVVGSDGTNVYTVEGNSGDQVRTKSYALNSNVIFGYGLPNY